MRILPIYAIILIFFNCKSEKDLTIQKYEITVNVQNCKYPDNHITLQHIELVKDNKTIRSIPVEHQNKLVISDLIEGIYQIRYASIYNRYEQIEVKIGSGANKDFQICTDFLDYSSNKNILFIDEMQDQEKLTFDYTSQGCFHSDNGRFEILRENNIYSLSYKDRELKLTKRQLQLIREFEIELRSNHNSGCTTTDTYSIYRWKNFGMYSTTDGSCSWRGFNHLIKNLDLINE